MDRKDAAAFMCEMCRQTFMVNARPPLLWTHVQTKHPAGTDPLACFPVQLKDFDPNDPKGEKKVQVEESAPVKPKKVVKKKDDALDEMLNSGLAAAKKKVPAKK